jgi:WD40 repeat protein
MNALMPSDNPYHADEFAMNQAVKPSFSFVFASLIAVAVSQEAMAQTPIAVTVPNRATPVHFEREILPILRKSCVACHNASDPQSELNLESPQSILKGGDRGPAVVAKNGAASLLLKVASRNAAPKMPPMDNDVGAKPLTPAELGLIKLWIDQGATGVVTGAVSPTSWRPLPKRVNPIYATAVTDDGQFAACGRANQIFIYHVPTGRVVTRLTDPSLVNKMDDARPGIAHRDIVQSLTFNRAGDLLASGGFRTIKLWRRPKDVQQFKFAAGTTPVSAVAVSPDGRWIASATAENTVKLWNPVDGKPGPVLTGHTAAVTSLQFTPDGSRLVSGSVDKTIRVWNLEDGSLVARLDTPVPVNALTLPGDGTDVVTGGPDNFIRHWSLPASLSQPMTDIPQEANVLAVSPNREFLAMANAKGTVRIIEFWSGNLINTFKAQEAAISDMAFSANGFMLATASADRTVRVWSYATGKQLAAFRGGLAEVRSVAFSPDSKQLVAGSADGKMTVWNVDAPTLRLFESTDETPVVVQAVSTDGKLVATNGSLNGRPAIRIHDVATGKPLRTLLGHLDVVTALSFNADSTRLVSGSVDKTVRVWNLTESKFPEMVKFTGHADSVTAVSFNANATQVLSSAADKTLKLWPLADPIKPVDFAGHAAAVIGSALTPDGKLAISASADKTIRIWNTSDGKQSRAITAPIVLTTMSVSRDGTKIAVAGTDFSIRLYNQADGKLLSTLTGHTAAMKSLAFSADNTRLVSAGSDNLSIVWNVADGRLLEMVPAVDLGTVAFAATNGELLQGVGNTGITAVPLRFVRPLGDLKQPITQLVYNGNGQTVYCASSDGTMRGFMIATGQKTLSANHGAPIRDLAMTPNGQLLATAGDDKLVKLWNAANGAPAANPQLAGFTDVVTQLAFSADGTRLVAGSAKAGEIFVYDVTSRTLEQSFVEHTGGALAITCLGRDRGKVVTASADKTVRVWELSAKRRITGHTKPITSLASLPGNEPLQVLSGSEDGTVRHWNLTTGQAVRQMNHGGLVRAVAVRNDGQRFASVGDSKSAKLWNATNGAQVAELKGDIRAKTRLARAKQEFTLATAKVTDAKAAVAAAAKVAPTRVAAAKVATNALTAANKVVTDGDALVKKTDVVKTAAEKVAIEAAAAAQKASVAKVLADKNVAVATKAMQKGQARATRAKAVADASPKDATLAQARTAADAVLVAASTALKTTQTAQVASVKVATDAGTAANAAATKAVAAAKPYTDGLTALRAAKTKQTVATQASVLATRENKEAQAEIPRVQAILVAGELRLKNAQTEVDAATKAVADAEQPVRAVSFSDDGRLLATGGDFPVVHTWDATTGAAVGSYVGHVGGITTVDFTPNGGIVSGSVDKSAVVWDGNPGWMLERTIGSIDDPATIIDRVSAVDFHPNGTLLASAGGVPSRTGEVKIWNVADGKLVRNIPEPHTDAVFAVRFSRDGTLLASASADKYVRTFNVSDGKLAQSFEGHTNHVLGVSWRSDGNVLASCSADNSITIWNAKTGDRIRRIVGFNKHVSSIQFIGETTQTIACSGDLIVRQHNTTNGGVVRNYAGAADFMYSVTATPNGQFIIAGGYASVLRVWNGANAQVLHVLEPPKPTTVLTDEATTSETTQTTK